MQLGATVLNDGLVLALLIGGMLGQRVLSARQAKHDYTGEMAEVVQTFEAANRQLREELTAEREQNKRISQHRDQLLVENMAMMRELALYRKNGNGHGNGHA